MDRLEEHAMATSKQQLPTTDALAAALDALEEARKAFEEACYTVRDSIDLTPLTLALAAWRAAADTVNELATDASNDITAYQAERSERWLASARGKAVEEWQQDFDEMQLGLDPEDSLQLHIDLTGDTPSVELITDPDDLLPATPEIPELGYIE
jgi:hypothetical protein